MNTIVHLATAVLIPTLGVATDVPEAASHTSRMVSPPVAAASASALDLRRQPALGEVLRSHGFGADRLGRSEERALPT